MAVKDVTLEPASTGNADVTPHNLENVEDGDTIKFSTVGSVFTVTIPDADKLFSDYNKEVWCARIGAGKNEVTPEINSGLEAKSEWPYYVYCEEKRNWADNPGSSPPKIIIVD